MFHSTIRSSTVRSVTAALIATILTALGLVVVGITLTATPAQATCIGTSPATGSWHNTDPNTNSITRVVVDWGCPDQGAYHPAGSIRVFGKCHPTDCDWGTRRTYAETGGWERARYDHSWATKHVWIKPYSFYGRTYLRVWVYTDFTPADGRKDYVTDVWMLK